MFDSLNTASFDHPLISECIHLTEVDSTMKYSEFLVKDKALTHSFIVISERQSEGRGRKGHVWHSDEGGLWFTLGLYGYRFHPSLMIYIGLLLRRTLSSLFDHNSFKIKWPNDIYLSGKKCCGLIATQMNQERFHLIGIGINTNNKIAINDHQLNAISLIEHFNQSVDHHLILTTFLNFLNDSIENYQIHNLSVLKEEFNQFHLLQNRNIVLETGDTQHKGICRGITEEGALILESYPQVFHHHFAGSIIQF